MQKHQLVSEMALEVLRHQAAARTQRTAETLEQAFKVVLETEAGQLLEELRKGPHCDEDAEQWQENLAQQREDERHLARQEERRRARQEERRRAQLAAYKSFMQAELRELEFRKDGQLARLLGELLPVELPAALARLATEDQRQAEEGLVALMMDGKVSYKRLDELSPDDMAARIAAKRARTGWLKERRDAWSERV